MLLCNEDWRWVCYKFQVILQVCCNCRWCITAYALLSADLKLKVGDTVWRFLVSYDRSWVYGRWWKGNSRRVVRDEGWRMERGATMCEEIEGEGFAAVVGARTDGFNVDNGKLQLFSFHVASEILGNKCWFSSSLFFLNQVSGLEIADSYEFME